MGITIAFALHSLLGEALETVEFDQTKLRDYLLKVFEGKSLFHFQKCQFLVFDISISVQRFSCSASASCPTLRRTQWSTVRDAVDAITQSMLDFNLFLHQVNSGASHSVLFNCVPSSIYYI